ncbi:MAG: hypothetical protein J6A63_00845 [Clostridia bacterium]|nr:hypothetical protein [Clostridia bacterium]MBP3422342.1 hypothetical protein [Clostridia bacterium]
MKKFLFILMTALLTFAVTACASEEKTSSIKDNDVPFHSGGFELPEDEF